MSTTFYVWYPDLKKLALGHASVKVAGTYMSWWPASENKMRSLLAMYNIKGTSVKPPSYDDDVKSEGKAPEYVGDLYGWDDQKALDYWNTNAVPNFLKAFGEIKKAHAGETYKFVTCNCATMV